MLYLQPTYPTIELLTGPASSTLPLKSLYWKTTNMLTFKILHGMIHNSITFTATQTQHATRRMHQNMLEVRRPNTVSYGDVCFSHNAPKLYNELPLDLRTEHRVSTLKRKLNIYYKEIPQLVKAVS